MASRITADVFEEEVLKSDVLTVADFYSDSCIPCKRMSPLLAELEEENPEIKLVKININFDPALAEKYEVLAAPTLIFFKNGEESDRIRGAAKKSEIQEKINNLK
ncbi:MAG: thioredoxin family protein [Huintestinicola sp.]